MLKIEKDFEALNPAYDLIVKVKLLSILSFLVRHYRYVLDKEKQPSITANHRRACKKYWNIYLII